MSESTPPVPSTPRMPRMRSWPRSTAEGLLEHARSVGVLSSLDQQFASRLSNLYGETNASVCWAVAITCRQESAGHVCADLHRLGGIGLNAIQGFAVSMTFGVIVGTYSSMFVAAPVLLADKRKFMQLCGALAAFIVITGIASRLI